MGKLFALLDICHNVIPVIATHSNLTLPELVKRAALECFIYPEKYKKQEKYFLRETLRNLEERGALVKE